MVTRSIEVAGISMRRGTDIATVITDGKSVMTYEQTGRTQWCSMSRAISYLECKGYSVDTEDFIN